MSVYCSFIFAYRGIVLVQQYTVVLDLHIVLYCSLFTWYTAFLDFHMVYCSFGYSQWYTAVLCFHIWYTAVLYWQCPSGDML